MINQDNYSSRSIIKRLMVTYILDHRVSILLSILAMIIVAIGNGANAYLIQPILDKIFINHDLNMLYFITFMVLLVAITKGIGAYFQNYLMKKLGQQIIAKMQLDLYAHLINSDLSLINSYSTGKLISRFTNDINTMRNSVSIILTGIARDFLSLVFLIGVMFYQNFILSILAFTVFPLTVYPIIRLGKSMRKVAIKTQEELGNYTTQLDETFKNIRIIKSYNQENYEISRAKKIVDNILKLYLKAARTEALSSPIMETLSGIAIALVIWYGGKQVVEGTTTAGSFLSFLAALIISYKPIKTLSDLNTNLQEGLAAAKRFFMLLDTKPEIISKPNAINLNVKNGNIEFKNINFEYPNGKLILENFDLSITGGKTIAFVGESGSGKSTIVNILLRLYEPKNGTVKIDDIDIKDTTLTSLRNQITIVTQEVAIFDDNVLNNIKYGNSNATTEEILKAAKLAMVDEFVEKLPNKYEEFIGQSGIKLSGGQRQRIAIARSLLKDSPILILDEATSSLDNILEAKIMGNIKNIRKGKTNIIIAHRLSTIIDADIIFVMHGGRILEVGSHNKLISEDTYYRKLYLKNTQN